MSSTRSSHTPRVRPAATTLAAVALATLCQVSACSDENASHAFDGGQGGQGGATKAVGGSTGEGGVRADAGSPLACDNPSDPIEPAAVLSDFENGSSQLADHENRVGAWWSSGDTTAGGILKPNGEVRPESIPGGRCGSLRALHVTGSGFLDWGATVGVSLNYGPNDAGTPGDRPWDASAYRGVTFWARVGETSGNEVRIGVSDEYANPAGGLCMIGGGQGKDCYDSFGIDLPRLDTTWRKYKIAFSGLTQRGFGVASPTGKLDASAIYHIEFATPSGAVFDFWLDDIGFY